MDVAQFFLSGQHRKQGRGAEDGQKVHEVSSAERSFTFRCETENAVVAPEDSLGKHEFDQFSDAVRWKVGKAWDVGDPGEPLRPPDSPFLQDQGH